MDKEIFDFSFDEIVNGQSSTDNITTERLIEIKRYERMYLLKPQGNDDLALADISDDKRLSLFENIEFNGFRRNYIENLLERDYSLEGCTPYQFLINGLILEDGSWGDLLCKIASFLLMYKPELRSNILEFRAPWTKAVMFSEVKKTNYKPIEDNLFLNCNHTALHSCWLIQDMLDYFGVDKTSVKLLLHRPSSAERKELKEYIESQFKRGVKHYICKQYERTEEYSNKVIRNIEKYLTPYLAKISKSYSSLFLFDDLTVVSSYLGKIKEMIKGEYKYDDKTKKILYKYIRFLHEFYKL